ncbi:MAG: ABC transporter ATP-binding protein [Chloroflexota bacterium]
MSKKSKDALIKTNDLTRIYGDGEVVALDKVTIEIDAGELVSIMGPSGSGKSTLLNMLGALDQPTSGNIIVDNQDLAKLKDVDAYRSQTVGFIFQMHNLLPTLNAAENVEVPMMGQNFTSSEREMRSAHLLDLVGLADRLKHLPSQLSGGQRQRVAVARSLANNPLLILADEPTGNLDSESGSELIALLRDINQSEGATVVIVTHDPAVSRQTNRVIVMADGAIIRQDIIGSPLEEDLKMWQHSGLGRRILDGQSSDLKQLKLSKKQMETLQTLLENNTP